VLPFCKGFGVNGLTRATLAYFLIAFVIALWEIFIVYSRNILKKSSKKCFKLKKTSSYYFIKIYVKNLAKNIIFRKFQIHLQVFLLFKNKCYNA
jgi:hypothetical protein